MRAATSAVILYWVAVAENVRRGAGAVRRECVGRMMTKRSDSRRLTLLHADQEPVLMRRMLTTGFGVHRRNVMREDDGSCSESTAAGNPMRHIHHHAYACWDSEETRHFYEDILGMPLIATVVTEDPLRNDGSRCCHTVFEIADGNTLAFFEHTSLAHPKYFNAKSGCHRHVAFEVEGDATVQQFKRKLDAAGVANILMNLGALLCLRFNDPNGLILEFMAKVGRSFEYERTSRASAHSELQQWLQHRQNWWRNVAE